MATVNLIDAFWLEVVPVAMKVGSQDLAIGNAARFFRYAQEKHKQGRLITEREFKEQGFLEALIPIFATRTPDGIMAVGADKHFGWLRERITAASKGGSASSEKKRLAALKREAEKRAASKPPLDANGQSDFNSLGTSKPQANSSNHKPYPFPYAYAVPNSDTQGELVPTAPPSDSAPPKLHWLALMWNEKCGSLPKVHEISNKRLTSIRARLRECNDGAVWADVITRIAASDFCNGRVPGKTWKADFDFLIKPQTRISVSEGKYDNRGQKKGATDREPVKKANSELDELYRQAGFDGAPDGL